MVGAARKERYAGDRDLTSDERHKETSVLYTCLADVGTTTMLLAFALLTGSLSLLSDGVRSVLMLGISFFSYWALRTVHRERMPHYQYGLGKLERLVWIVVGLGLVVGALWLARTVVLALLSPAPPASPLGLSTAAVINGVNTVVNTVGWLALVAASRADDSEVYRAQLRARFTMLVSSLFVQTMLTGAALAKDAGIAEILDAAGATFVSCLMLYNGISMMAHALPDLLDAPAPAEHGESIRRAVLAVVRESEIAMLRTRRSGRRIFAEVRLWGTSLDSFSALRAKTSEIEEGLRREGREVELAVTLGPLEGRPSGSS